MALASPCAAPRTRSWCRDRAATPTTSICRGRPMRCWSAAATGTGSSRSIDTSAAKAMPGVLAIYTGADLAAYGTMKCAVPFKNRDGSEMKKPLRPSLVSDKVRFVGDPVAVVIAETLAQAKDAAEAVELDIETLPAVTQASEAAKPGAPQLYDDVPGNVALDYLYGDPAKVAEAFSKAAHVTKLTLVNSRVVVSAMEPRSAIASFDKASGRYTMNIGCQGAFGMKGQLVDILGVTPDKVHVLSGQCRRLVRHEGRGLSRIRADPACREGTGPAGEVDRRPLRELHVRPSRPRPRIRRRACARREGQVPRRALHRLRQHRRVSRPGLAADVDPEHREERGQRLQTSADRSFHQGGVHQHDPGLGLSRRGAARGQLLHGAADRPRGGGNEHRPFRAAPAQPDQAEGNSLQGLVRHAVRQRRLSRRVRARRRNRRHERLQAAQARGEEARQAARPRARQLSGSHRAAEQGNGRHPVRTEWRRDHHHRHARLRPGPRGAVRAGAERETRCAVRAHQAAARRQR